MAHNLQTNELITSYLLGELPEPELSRLEERFFTQDDFYTLVLNKEDELIENYLRGALHERERAQFEKSFLRTAERRKKVEIYKALIFSPVAQHQQTTQQTLWQSLLTLLRGHKLIMQTALASLALLALAGFGYYLVNRRAPDIEQAQRGGLKEQPASVVEPTPEQSAEPTPIDRSSSDTPPPSNNQSATGPTAPRRVPPSTPQKSNEKSAPPIEMSGIATLLPSVVRGESGQNVLKIAAGGTTVPVKILLAAETYNSYHAVLRTQGGKEVWSSRNLKARRVEGQSVLVLQLPVSALSQKYYLLDLEGETGRGRSKRVNYYPFTVIRN